MCVCARVRACVRARARVRGFMRLRARAMQKGEGGKYAVDCIVFSDGGRILGLGKYSRTARPRQSSTPPSTGGTAAYCRALAEYSAGTGVLVRHWTPCRIVCTAGSERSSQLSYARVRARARAHTLTHSRTYIHTHAHTDTHTSALARPFALPPRDLSGGLPDGSRLGRVVPMW